MISPKAYPFLHEFDPSRYPPAYLRSGLLEEQVQEAIVCALQAKWRAAVTVVDVGEKRLRGRLIRSGVDPRQLAGRGGAMERGVVDLAVTFPGGLAGWFEAKRPAHLIPSRKTGRLVQKHAAGTPTPEQLDFLEQQRRRGAIVGVLWGTTDLDEVIAAYQAPPSEGREVGT